MNESRYILRRYIDKGGWAEVWEGTDTLLQRQVAIKLFTPGASDISSALQHARALTRVSHANVVGVFDICTLLHPTEGEDWNAIVMELLEGPALLQLQNGPISSADADVISTGILEGIQALHDAGVVHTDLHAGNILMHKGVPKILDVLYRGTLAAVSEDKRASLVKQDIYQAVSVVATLLSRSGRQGPADALRSQQNTLLTANQALQVLQAELLREAPSLPSPLFIKGALVKSNRNSDQFALRHGVVTDTKWGPDVVEVAFPGREPTRYLANSLELEEEQPTHEATPAPVHSPLLIVSQLWQTGRVGINNGPTFLLASVTWWQELSPVYRHLFGWRGAGEVRAIVSGVQPQSEEEMRLVAEEEVAKADARFIRVDQLWFPDNADVLASLISSAHHVRLLQDIHHRKHYGVLYDFAVRAGDAAAELVKAIEERLPLSLT